MESRRRWNVVQDQVGRAVEEPQVFAAEAALAMVVEGVRGGNKLTCNTTRQERKAMDRQEKDWMILKSESIVIQEEEESQKEKSKLNHWGNELAE